MAGFKVRFSCNYHRSSHAIYLRCVAVLQHTASSLLLEVILVLKELHFSVRVSQYTSEMLFYSSCRKPVMYKSACILVSMLKQENHVGKIYTQARSHIKRCIFGLESKANGCSLALALDTNGRTTQFYHLSLILEHIKEKERQSLWILVNLHHEIKNCCWCGSIQFRLQISRAIAI